MRRDENYIWSVTSGKVPNTFWLARTLDDVLKYAGIDRTTNNQNTTVALVSPKHKNIAMFKLFLGLRDYLMLKDPRGEYDWLPLCHSTLEIFKDVLTELYVKQPLPFIKPNYELAFHLTAAEALIELFYKHYERSLFE